VSNRRSRVLALRIASVAWTHRSGPDRYTTWAGGDPTLEIQQQTGDPLTNAVAAMPGVTKADGVTFVEQQWQSDGTLIFRPNPFAGSDRIGGGRVVEGRTSLVRRTSSR
jgi:hypothetical protein